MLYGLFEVLTKRNYSYVKIIEAISRSARSTNVNGIAGEACLLFHPIFAKRMHQKVQFPAVGGANTWAS
jgi:hypothetical protein